MAESLPVGLYNREGARALDQLAQRDCGVSGAALMKRAGRAAFSYAQQAWPACDTCLVLAGGGNNAGDGYVVAGLAAERGQAAQVLWLKDPADLTGDAARAHDFARQAGVAMTQFSEVAAASALTETTWLVDALLGIGGDGELSPPYRAAIEWLNAQAAPILALDLPSGLNADTGAALPFAEGATPLCVNATATVTFIAPKLGLYTGMGPMAAGSLLCDDLGLPPALLEQVAPAARMPMLPALKDALPTRTLAAHKGQFGHLLVVGGSAGFGGAAIMAAEAAATTGVGLLGLATHPLHIGAAITRRPEVMALGVESGQELTPALERPTALAVGPGLGQGAWGEQLLRECLAAGQPLVIDADALNLLAGDRLRLPERAPNWVLTPHPGEAARLLNCSVSEVERDRPGAARKLQARFGGVIVLKGLGTLVAAADGELAVLRVGNPGLAHGGTGDILTGIIGGLLAQGLEPWQAAQLGVAAHGDAADLAAADYGVRGLAACDLIAYIREILAE